MTLVPEWLRQRASLTPARLALRVGETDYTFAQLDRRVDEVASALYALGVKPGDRVTTLLPNGLRPALLAHAVPRAGGILVPLNTRLTPAELGWQVDDVGACLLLHDPNNEATAAALTEGRPRLHAALAPLSRGAAPVVPFPDRIDLGRTHSIIYTSGTTGRPKGVMLTFGNFWWSATGSTLNLGLHVDDRWLAPLPLFHVGGLSILLRGVIGGMAAVVHEPFDPARVNAAIDAEGITIVSVVSTMLQRLLDERNGRPYPPSLRCVLLGGGPAPLPLLQRAVALGVPVVQTYGMTETCSQAATIAPEDALVRLGSAGKPLFAVEIAIEGDGGRAAAGRSGQIVVRGPNVTPGYYGRPDETARALQNGWLQTGDLGYLDGEGYLYVLDRRDDLIVSGGENVYPAEIEAVLLAHPAVQETAVVGIPHPEWGQVPAALVRLCPGVAVAADELADFCRGRLAAYKVPRPIRYSDEALPRNAGGKLLRRGVRAQFLSEAGQDL